MNAIQAVSELYVLNGFVVHSKKEGLVFFEFYLSYENFKTYIINHKEINKCGFVKKFCFSTYFIKSSDSLFTQLMTK